MKLCNHGEDLPFLSFLVHFVPLRRVYNVTRHTEVNTWQVLRYIHNALYKYTT